TRVLRGSRPGSTRRASSGPRPPPLERVELFRRIDAGERARAREHPNADAVLERAQLLEPFGALPFGRRPRGELEQEIAAEPVDADVTQARLERSRGRPLTRE